MNRTWGTVVWLLVIAVAAAVAFRFAPPARAQVGVGLALSEILAGPSRDWNGDGAFDARKDEWAEIWNSGAGPVDLSAYRLADADSTIRYEFSGSLAGGSVVLVLGSAAEDQQRALGRTVTGLSLNNAGDCPRCHFQVARIFYGEGYGCVGLTPPFRAPPGIGSVGLALTSD
jgi:hypothetical protein